MVKPTDDDDFLASLQKGVKAVLENKESKPADIIAAITAGTKILQTKHKIKDDDDGDSNGKSGSFFTAKK